MLRDIRLGTVNDTFQITGIPNFQERIGDSFPGGHEIKRKVLAKNTSKYVSRPFTLHVMWFCGYALNSWLYDENILDLMYVVCQNPCVLIQICVCGCICIFVYVFKKLSAPLYASAVHICKQKTENVWALYNLNTCYVDMFTSYLI